MSEPDAGNPIVMIRGDKVGLGPIRRDLITTYQRWFNELRVTRTLDLPSRPITFEDETSWFESAATGATVFFTIYELATMRPIGNLDLRNIDHYNGTAEYGIAIGEIDAWGKGYGTEATRLMLAYAFDVLGLHNVQLAVYTTNPGGQRAYERAGFKRSGIRRGGIRVGRERYDIIYMDATADDIQPGELHAIMHPGIAGAD
ncbi:MAG TPA: GNAT family protein [Thermomicrobiales bacterium]|nr:GNAT family protein [Thermomicrobiales bacterium]